ncbi:MAG: hypothetical protein ABI611_17705, partial [Solirubrobacteraceae bacterium]
MDGAAAGAAGAGLADCSNEKSWVPAWAGEIGACSWLVGADFVVARLVWWWTVLAGVGVGVRATARLAGAGRRTSFFSVALRFAVLSSLRIAGLGS